MGRMEPARLPRFKLSSSIPPLQLTTRDRRILEHVHAHRFLRSDHLTSLLPGSRQQTLRRLQLLYHHGYLERPRCQIDYYQSGSRRIAYGIGNKGAALLKRELALPFHRLDWGQKNHVSRLFLEHALLVSDVMVALEVACRKQAGIRLLTQNLHRTRFGWPRFRARTVTTSAKRVQHLLDACQRLGRGHGLFLFTDIKTLKDHLDFFSLSWQTGPAGKFAGLLD